MIDIEEHELADIVTETIMQSLKNDKQHAIRTLHYILKCNPDLLDTDI